MKFFIAGIMQGSKIQKAIHTQDYREVIKQAICEHIEGAEVYDPYQENKNSLEYGDETGLQTFLRHNNLCATEIDVVIAFIPEASMGTAIEMWEAWKNKAKIISISPMTRNWVVRYLSHAIYPDIESFLVACREGKIV